MAELKSSLDVFPLEIWLLIAESSPAAWRQLTQVVRDVGLYSLDENVQCRMMNHFVDVDTNLLPNSARHGGPFLIGDKGRTEAWYVNDKLHRDDDLPALRQYLSTVPEEFGDDWNCEGADDPILYETWYQYGQRHRDNDEPAFRSYLEFGPVDREEWWQHDKLHRDDGPATIDYHFDCNLLFLECVRFFQHGRLHRDEDLPAVIRYLNHTRVGQKVLFEIWYQDGHIHRDNDKPARLEYCAKASKLRSAKYYHYGELHRDSAPAVVEFRDGDYEAKCHCEWWQFGAFTEFRETYVTHPSERPCAVIY